MDTPVIAEPRDVLETGGAPLVCAEALNFFYGEGKSRFRVLFDISLDVLPGQLIVMTGPSGSGKTPL